MKIQQEKWINPEYVVSVEYIEDIEQTRINTLDGKTHVFHEKEAKIMYDYYVEKRLKSKVFSE